MIKACIFDLDGVIVDTAKYHFQSWRKLANELGFDINKEQDELLKGVSRMESLDILLNFGGLSFDQEKKEQLAAQKNEWYIELISHMTPEEIFPGVRELISELRDQGIKTALGSASKNAMHILEHINMVNDFDAIIDGNKITKTKPDPQIFLKAAEALNVEPKMCIVFEDAKAGIESAINANMIAIGVGHAQNLTEAKFVIPSLADITVQEILAL